MIEVKKILEIHRLKTIEWHIEMGILEVNEPNKFIEMNHQWNFKLWHEEDIARITEIEDSRIVTAKRNIDFFNQQRNNAMELIDEWVLTKYQNEISNLAPLLHTETVGMMVDRLSIMALKKYHMLEQTERTDVSNDHILGCKIKANTLSKQIEDLANGLDRVINKIKLGELEFKVYRQFKMYNDENLNPQLYKNKTV